MTFGQLVADARHGKGLSQEALAKSIGVDRSMVSQIERGHRGVSVDTLSALMDALDLDDPAAREAVRLAARVGHGNDLPPEKGEPVVDADGDPSVPFEI